VIPWAFQLSEPMINKTKTYHLLPLTFKKQSRVSREKAAPCGFSSFACRSKCAHTLPPSQPWLGNSPCAHTHSHSFSLLHPKGYQGPANGGGLDNVFSILTARCSVRVVLRIEPRVSRRLGKRSATELCPHSHFFF
jgi:hypothetical protein